MTREVGIYTRISQADHDTQTATHRQEAASRQFASARDWSVVDVFEDVDVSAYSGVERPAFERMLKEIEHRSITGVVVWKLDRLVRRPKDFERFWDVCERHHAILASVTEPLDSSTDLGLALVRMLVVMATFESATRGARVRSLFEEVALRGDPPLGGERPWGLTAHWRELVPEEAALLREAARRLISGELLHQIVKDWTSRGITARNGSPWTGPKLRSTIVRPRIAGLRVSRGSIIGKGNFPAVLDEQTYGQVLAILTHPTRQHPGRRHGARHDPAYLLTKLLRCAKCGGRFSSSVMRRKSDETVRYVCLSRPHGCGSVSVARDPLDAWVAERLFEYLDSVGLRQTLDAERTELERAEPAALAATRQELDQLALDHYRYRLLSPRRYEAVRRSLCVRIDRERAALGLRMRIPELRALAGRGTELCARWETMGADERRQIAAFAISHVDVGPASSRRGSSFDPDRVRVWWKA
jgi:DNA invertase Pin-like site-specific DNA recombinase